LLIQIAELKQVFDYAVVTKKYIFIDSLCRIALELDMYHFLPKKGFTRDFEIRTRYANGKGKNTLLYNYEIGNDSRNISRQQADSLLAAEKIAKDY